MISTTTTTTTTTDETNLAIRVESILNKNDFKLFWGQYKNNNNKYQKKINTFLANRIMSIALSYELPVVVVVVIIVVFVFNSVLFLIIYYYYYLLFCLHLCFFLLFVFVLVVFS